tara:strand:- start:234 stop:911 length:678 start_codon:yes stop_codon:yes gene_type:complete
MKYIFIILLAIPFSVISQITADEYFNITTKNDTVYHGQDYESKYQLKKEFIKDSLFFVLKFGGREMKMKNGIAIIKFRAFHRDFTMNDSIIQKKLTFSLEYKGQILESDNPYWTKPDPAYIRSLNKTKPTREFQLLFKELVTSDGLNLSQVITKEFNLNDKKGHLITSFLILSDGRIEDIEIKTNTFKALSNESLIIFLGLTKMTCGEVNNKCVNILDFVIIQNK